MSIYSNEEAIRNAKNTYARQWRAKNKDKVRAANERYWLKVAEQMKPGGGNNCAKHENH